MKKPIRYSGPYIFSSGKCRDRKFMTVYYDDGSKGTTLYSRYLMELHLGRRLHKSEQVDHINEDKTDDRVENFQLLSSKENIRKSALTCRPAKKVDCVCPFCNRITTKTLRYVKHNKRQGKAGPFCSKTCAGKWSTKIQYQATNTVCGTNAMYARGCKCMQCKLAHNESTKKWKQRRARSKMEKRMV